MDEGVEILMSQQNVPAWKKTALATVAFSMLAGSATGLVASAKSHGRNDDEHDGDNGKTEIRYNLEFKDVSEKQLKWAYANIIRMVAQGVFKGYEDGSFKPQNKVTRLETIIAAVRVLGLEAEAQKPENMNAKLNFKDFDQLKKKNPQAVGYVKVALANDLFNENDVSIKANEPASRLWASVLLVKAMKLEAQAKAKMDVQLPFRDANHIPAGSVGYVALAIEKNLIAGYNDNTFQPNKPVTRAELAAILSRLGIQLPGYDQRNGIEAGVVTVNSNGTITVVKGDNTTVNYTLDAAVFVFRNGVKVPISALQVGDQLSVRVVQGQVIFIEVTKSAETGIITDTGTVTAINTGAKTITLQRQAGSIVYNLDANVSITPAGVVAVGQNVVVTGTNGLVKTIAIIQQ
jgi:hypothetical protein